MTRSFAGVSSLDAVVGACVDDPDRWMTAIDDDAKALCRDCPRRWLCARDACETPRAEGMWAGIVIPEAGRDARTRCTDCVHWPSGAATQFAGRPGDRPDGGRLAGADRSENPGNFCGNFFRKCPAFALAGPGDR